MANIEALPREDLSDLTELLGMVEASMGFVPNSFLIMARWPELLKSFAGMAGLILSGGSVEPGLKQLVAFVSSTASGCRYCQAHTSHSATHRGVSEEKIAAAFEFESSDLFCEAERCALRLAAHAGMTPNASEDAHFDALKEHFSAAEIVEIVGVISLFGFLNRWNDTLATELEEAPFKFGQAVLSTQGWDAGKHTPVSMGSE